MKNLFVFILVNIYFLSFAKAQNSYINAIFKPNDINGLSSRGILLQDSSVYVMTTMDGSNSIIKNAYFKFNKEGLLQNYKIIGVENYHFFGGYWGCFGKTSDGNFFTAGAVQDSISYPTLLKINTNFDTLFLRIYNDTLLADASFQQGKETADKGFILVGTKSGPGTYDMDILAIKTDSLGNEQWHKYISLGSGIEYARNVIQTPDNGFLLGCYSYNSQISLSGDGIIIKLDSLGNIKWTKTLFGPNQDGVPMLALAKDSNIYVATSYAYYTEFLGFSDLKLQVLKLNKNNGNTIWNRQYDTIRTACYPRMIKVDEIGNPMIIGSEFYPENGYYNEQSWVFKLNSNGDSIFFRRFNKTNDQNTITNRVFDFCTDEEKNIYICGEFSDSNTPQSLWLVKMDSLGCLQPGCDPTAGIEEPYYLKPGQLQIYPNPATTQTTITYPIAEKALTLQIYNMLGQKVYEEKLSKGSSQTTIDTRAYKKGLYKVVVGESSGMLLIQ